MNRSAPHSGNARMAVRSDRRTALELARIYVSSAANGAALEVLSRLPANGWDEEIHLLRAEALIGVGRLSDAHEIVGPPVLPVPNNARSFDVWRFLLQLRILHRQGEYRRVVEIGRAYFDLGEGVPSVYLARTAMVVAQSMLAMKCPAEAREFYKHVRELYERLGSSEGQVDALLGIANTHLLDCHWDRADALYQEARFRYEELGQTDKALAACINLGVVRVKRGEFLSGRDLLEDALARSIQLGAHRRAMTIHLALAMAEIRSGNEDAARPHLNHVLRAARRDRVGRDLGLALEFLGESHLRAGRWDRAEKTLRRALAVGERIAPEGDIVFEVTRRLAEVALGRGDLDEAKLLAEKSRALAERFGDTYEVATCKRVLAEVAYRSGSPNEAAAHADSASMMLGRLGETFERNCVHAMQERWNRAERRFGNRRGPVARSVGRRDERPDGRSVGRRDERPDGRSVGRPDGRLGLKSRARVQERDIQELRAAGLESRSPSLTRALVLAKAVARLDIPILLTGETGSGLEWLGRLVHRWSGRRGLYVPFHCAGLDPDALERELLGRNGRSGLDRIADGGTVFLDSVSDLGPESQRRLARWIHTQTNCTLEARIRIIAASRRRGDEPVAAMLVDPLRRGLEQVVIDIPPLRERREDIPLLVEDILIHRSKRFGRPVRMPSPRQIEVWQAQTWPGNLEELREAVERHLAHDDGSP